MFGQFTQTGNLMLGTLANYGGITQTIPLLPGSAAIDAGTNDYTPTYDQRGLPRHYGQCDVGAFESQGFTLAKSGGDGQMASVNTAFWSPLAVTVSANNAVEPVNNGRVTFTPPSSGASAAISGNPATISVGGASVLATANGTAGPYGVSAGGAGMGSAVSFSLTNAAASSPPPVGDGKNGTTGATFAKRAGAPDFIDVTYDATHCSDQNAVILYGTLGNYSSYAGFVQCNGGNGGTTYVDSSSLSNAWFNILWTNATTAGHPGYAFNGTADVARTWTATGRCGTTADNQTHGTCP
jgi:hypothetical protein